MAIKADASLVQAALYEGKTGAMADVPNLKPLYESTAKISETAMDTMTGIMDQIKVEKELEAAAKEKRLQPLNEAAKGVYSALYDGKEPLPSVFIDAFQARIEELQDEFEKVNTEGEGDTKANARKRREITGELARLKNEAVNVRTNFMISTQDPDQWNTALIEDDLEGSLLAVFDLWKDPNNTPKGISAKIVNGKLEITAPGHSTEGRLKPGVNRPTTLDELFDDKFGDIYTIERDGKFNIDGKLYENKKEMMESWLGGTLESKLVIWDAQNTEKYQKPISRTFNSDDISKALNRKNKGNDSFILGNITDAAKLGAADGGAEGAGKKSTYYNDITRGQDEADIIAYLDQTPGAFRDMVVRGMEGVPDDPGMKKGLLSSGVLATDIIKSMFYFENSRFGSRDWDEEGETWLLFGVKSLDTDKDGDIDSEDAEGLEGEELKTFKKNWDVVLNTITNPDSDYFNKERSYKILAEYYTNFKEQSYNNSYTAAYEKKNPTKKTDYKALGDYYTYKSKEIKYLTDVEKYNADPPATDHFKHITASNPMSIVGVEITDKGSLGVMRERLLAGESFPIGDYITVEPDEAGGWTMIIYDEEAAKKGDLEVLDSKTYSSTEEFVKNGLRSTSPGFQNLKQYKEEETIVLTEEEKTAGVKIYGDGNAYKLNESDGLYYLYTRE